MDAITELVQRVEEAPRLYCLPRSAPNYAQLLDLYEEVGFGPSADLNAGKWREESTQSWKELDSLLPATTTVGIHDGKAVSSWGTIPLTPNLMYTHSVCMVKTLPAAVTLMAQALLSITWFERLSSMDYMSLGYASHSRFTVLFQRPLGFTIPGQVESETILCIQDKSTPMKRHTGFSAADSRVEDELLLCKSHRWIFDSLSHVYSGMESMHRIHKVSIWNQYNKKPSALALVHYGSPFLTAADVHREIVVFPLSDSLDIRELCQGLRSIKQFSSKPLYLFLSPNAASPSKIDGELVEPSFWIATERNQAALLRRSYVDAFTTLFRKYSQNEIGDYLASLQHGQETSGSHPEQGWS